MNPNYLSPRKISSTNVFVSGYSFHTSELTIGKCLSARPCLSFRADKVSCSRQLIRIHCLTDRWFRYSPSIWCLHVNANYLLFFSNIERSNRMFSYQLACFASFSSEFQNHPTCPGSSMKHTSKFRKATLFCGMP